MAIGGAIGGAVDPTKINGPHIGDGQQQTTTDGTPIAWVMGTAKIAGTLIWAGPRKEVKIKDSGGKGGPVVSHYESRQSFAILVCESSELKNSTINTVLMVEQDGKLVYDVRPGSAMTGDSAKWAANVEFHYGAEDQLPPSAIEADVGVGNCPAYRGRLVVVFEDFNIYAAGDRIPTFLFTVTSAVAIPLAAPGGGGLNYPTPYEIPISVPNVSGGYDVGFNPGQVPDKLKVVAGGTTLLDTGYWGDPGWQSQLNSALASFGDPPETISELPGGTPANLYDYPNIHQHFGFTKPSGIDSITIQVFSPSSGTSWVASLNSLNGFVGLAAVVSSICARGGVDPADIDVTALGAAQVVGYPIARACTAVDALAPLLQSYFAFATDYDSKLRFKFYGEDAQLTIDAGDLIEGNDANHSAITEDTRNQATEFPRRVIGSYIDPDQNFNTVTVSAERLSASVIAIGDQQFAIPLAMPADQAKQAVDKALKVAYATLEGTRDYCLPMARSAVYLTVCAGEPALMDGKRWVVDQIDVSNGYLKFSTRYDRQSAYRSTVQAIKGNNPRTPISRYSGPTTLVPMNLPSLRPQDTYGVYLAAKGTNDQASWRGCNVLVSYDNQQSWQNALTIVLGSVVGTLAAEIPSGGEPLTVDVGSGELDSITDAQLAANMNAFALIDSAGTAEIDQFKTATLLSGGDYDLTDVSRGLNGTNEGVHAVDDKFVMLDSVYFLPIDLAFSGKAIYFRAVGFGEVADNQPIVSIVYQPDMTIIHDGGTVT